MIYDLVVVGNGLAAQTFLYELFNHLNADVKNSQNFSVAQVFDARIAPPVSLHTTASVSLNGVKKGISPLGDLLFESYFAFLDFIQKHSPKGVEEVNHFNMYTQQAEGEKLKKRFGETYSLDDAPLKKTLDGVKLKSFILSPAIYSNWFEAKLNQLNIERIHAFYKGQTRLPDGTFLCDLCDKKIKAKKILFCTGAYTKSFSAFFDLLEMRPTKVVAGSFLLKKVDLKRESFFLTIDGHHLIYRNADHSLILGSASMEGAYGVADLFELKKIHGLFADHVDLVLGPFNEFEIVTGLRHKGVQRKPIAGRSQNDPAIFILSGFYKNGFSYAPYLAKKILQDIL